MVLRIILPEAEEQELKDIITRFFEGKPDTMSQKNYFQILEKFNSDVFYTIINYIYYNAIFEEKNIEIFIIHQDDAKSQRSSKYVSASNFEEEKLMCPTKSLERVLSILKEDRDLEELEEIETDIKLRKFDIKTMFYLDSPAYELKVPKTSRINKTTDLFKFNIDSEYDFEDYIFLKENEDDIKLKKYWGVLINKDLMIFESSGKLNLLYYYNLINKFIGKEINKDFYFDKSYYSFNIISKSSKITLFADGASKAKLWTEKIRKSIKSRIIRLYKTIHKFREYLQKLEG